MKRMLGIFVLSVTGLGLGGVSALYMAGLLGGRSPSAFADISKDHWSSDWSIGSNAADPYVRARVARHGLLALAKEEAVYFTRAVDDDGLPLTDRCSYEITGGAQDALWWSITLYDQESRLPMNGDHALSLDATKVKTHQEKGSSNHAITAGDLANINNPARRPNDMAETSKINGSNKWSAIIAPTQPNSPQSQDEQNSQNSLSQPPDRHISEHRTNTLWLSSRAAGTFDLTLRLYRPSAALLENPVQVLNAPAIRRLSCISEKDL